MKAKERRREMDKKRASDVEEKVRKEALRLKKEENAAMERKEKQAEKEKEEKKKQPTEKELKEAALLEKQRSVMLGFFNTPKPSSGTGGAAGGVGASSSSRSSNVFPTRVLTNRAGLGAAMGSTAALSHTLSASHPLSASASSSSSSSSSSPATALYSIDLSDDHDPKGTHTGSTCAETARRSFELAFEKDMSAKTSMGEISRSLRERCVMCTKYSIPVVHGIHLPSLLLHLPPPSIPHSLPFLLILVLLPLPFISMSPTKTTPSHLMTSHPSHHRYSSNERHPLSVPKGKPRKPKHLSVTVSVAGNAFAQGPETYRCVCVCVCVCVCGGGGGGCMCALMCACVGALG